MIDLKMIRMENMPGANGELLPQTAMYGGLKLTEEPGGRHFLIDAVAFNPKTATCGVCGFGCSSRSGPRARHRISASFQSTMARTLRIVQFTVKSLDVRFEKRAFDLQRQVADAQIE